MKRCATILWVAFAFAACGGARAGDTDIPLSAAEAKRVEERGILIRAELDANERRGTVRAAVRIDAPPAIVFRAMTQCADAFDYVPHLKVCRLRDSAPDGAWMVIDHEVDFGWYTPRLRYTFRADVVPDRRIDFRQVQGDFRRNEGLWEFEPSADGQRTVLKYRATIDPPGFIPNWLARSTYKRELPQMLEDLRELCEARHRAAGPATASPAPRR
jgi:uncharacterized protein YndB with AHSA1/START domain